MRKILSVISKNGYFCRVLMEEEEEVKYGINDEKTRIDKVTRIRSISCDLKEVIKKLNEKVVYDRMEASVVDEKIFISDSDDKNYILVYDTKEDKIITKNKNNLTIEDANIIQLPRNLFDKIWKKELDKKESAYEQIVGEYNINYNDVYNVAKVECKGNNFIDYKSNIKREYEIKNAKLIDISKMKTDSIIIHNADEVIGFNENIRYKKIELYNVKKIRIGKIKSAIFKAIYESSDREDEGMDIQIDEIDANRVTIKDKILKIGRKVVKKIGKIYAENKVYVGYIDNVDTIETRKSIGILEVQLKTVEVKNVESSTLDCEGDVRIETAKANKLYIYGAYNDIKKFSRNKVYRRATKYEKENNDKEIINKNGNLLKEYTEDRISFNNASKGQINTNEDIYIEDLSLTGNKGYHLQIKDNKYTLQGTRIVEGFVSLA